jgi:hypothetical protein
MKTPYFRYLSWYLVLWLSPFCLAQGVTVRVIDATNGHPLQKQQISVSLLYDKGERTPAKYDATLSLETDINGEAQFTLPEPAPVRFAAQVRLTSEHWHCGCTALVTTQDVIHKGIVAAEPGHTSKKSTVAAQVAPGEILFVARPLTFFERLLYPLVKG